MKKSLLVILALVMVLTLVLGLVSTASAAKPDRFYVTIVGAPTSGNLQFDYGWRSGKIKIDEYFIGIYKTGTGYVWFENAGGAHTYLPEPLRRATYSQDLDTITASGSYQIIYFVYDIDGAGGGADRYANFSIP